jgi:hypothetical protein
MRQHRKSGAIYKKFKMKEKKIQLCIVFLDHILKKFALFKP